MKSVFLFLMHFLAIVGLSHGQTEIAKITVHAGDFERENTLVCADLNGVILDIANTRPTLFEVRNGREVQIVAQLDMDNGPKLWWILHKNYR
jgi:hypothetical protein